MTNGGDNQLNIRNCEISRESVADYARRQGKSSCDYSTMPVTANYSGGFRSDAVAQKSLLEKVPTGTRAIVCYTAEPAITGGDDIHPEYTIKFEGLAIALKDQRSMHVDQLI